jgi:RHS repeat-associated protein
MNDASGNGRNGSYVNSPTLGVAGALPGDSDTALTVAPANYIAQASGISLANQSFSISFWMKRGSTGTDDYAVAQGTNATNNGLHMGFRSTNVFTIGFFNNDLNTSATYTDTGWHHWAATYDAGSNARKIYRDGVEVASGTASADYGGTGDLLLGSSSWNTSSRAMQGGSLDEVGAWTRVLTPAEVQQQYGTGNSGATAAAYRHQAYDENGQTLWTSLATSAATPGAVSAQEKTVLSYWDPGQIYSSQDPANPKVRFDYTAEGWQASRLPEQVAKAGFLDFGKSMYWDYLPDGLLRALSDQGGERALYAYDKNGNRTLATEATGLVNPGQTPLAIDLSYDSLDELQKVRTPKPGASGTYLATELSYDLNGNTQMLLDNEEEDGSGGTTAAGRVFGYTYNPMDQPTAQTDDFSTSGATDDEQILYTYTPRGELGTQTLQKGGSGSWVTEHSSERAYFENGLLRTLLNKNGAGTLIESHTQSYLQAGVFQDGNRVSDVFLLKGPDATATCYTTSCTQSWVHDAQERVRYENPGTGAATHFTLDVQGNVTQEVTGTATMTRTYSGQQLQTEDFSSGTDKRYLFDSLGSVDCVVKLAYSGAQCPAGGDANLLEDNIYDYKSRLAGFRAYNGSGALTNQVDYTYDPLDRPVKQVETIPGSSTTYDLTYVAATKSVSKEVLSGAVSTTRRYAYDAFTDRATIAVGANRYSYLLDPHGSVSLLIDQSNTVKESYAYSAYGAPNAALTKSTGGFNPGQTKTNQYRYTGRRLDVSGTYDLGARRYSSSTGRFLQYDTFMLALDNLSLSKSQLDQNRYAFAGANPVSFVDLNGHYVARCPDVECSESSKSSAPTEAMHPAFPGGGFGDLTGPTHPAFSDGTFGGVAGPTHPAYPSGDLGVLTGPTHPAYPGITGSDGDKFTPISARRRCARAWSGSAGDRYTAWFLLANFVAFRVHLTAQVYPNCPATSSHVVAVIGGDTSGLAANLAVAGTIFAGTDRGGRRNLGPHVLPGSRGPAELFWGGEKHFFLQFDQRTEITSVSFAFGAQRFSDEGGFKAIETGRFSFYNPLDTSRELTVRRSG